MPSLSMQPIVFQSPLGYADLENSESPFGSFNSSSSGGALRPTTSRPSFLGNMSRSLNSSNSLKAMADVVNGVNRSLNSSVSLKAMGDGAGRSLTTRRPSIGVLVSLFLALSIIFMFFLMMFRSSVYFHKPTDPNCFTQSRSPVRSSPGRS